MGLIINNMSGALQGQQLTSNNVGRSFMAATGAFGFLPHVPGSTTADGHVAPVSNIFLDNKDAAFIVSGTVGGKDKAVFMGDLVVSGNLSLGDGSSFVDAAADADATRVAFFDDSNTVGGDADLLFIEAGKFDANTGGQGRLELGDAAGDDVSIKLAAGDLQLFTDDEGGTKIASLLTNNATKLSITGALSPASGEAHQGLEIGSDAGVILGQGGGGHSDAAAGFILVSALAGSGDAGAAQPAVKVQAAAGGVEIDALKNIELDSAAKIIIDGNSDAADAVKINAGQGGIDILAAGAAGEDIDIVNNAGSVNVEGGESHADAVKISASGAAGGINIDSSALIDIDQEGDLGSSAADGFNVKVVNTNSATGADAMITLVADGKITLDSTDTTDGVVVAPTAGVPITLGTSTSTITIAGNLDVNGTTTTIDTKNLSIEDSLIALGVSGSDGTFTNVGDRAVIFARGAAAHSALPAVNWDGTNFNFATYFADSLSGSMGSEVAYLPVKANSLIVGDGGTIGSTSDTDAIAISAGGDVTLTEDLLFANGKTLGSAGTADLVTVNSDDLTIKGTKQVKVDIINESTGDAGVTIEGVAIVAGSSETTVGVSGDSDAIIFSNSGGTIQFSNTGESSSSSSGPVTFSGGVGVAKDLFVGDDLSLDSNASVLSLGATAKKISMSHVASGLSVAITGSPSTKTIGALSGPSITSSDTSIAFDTTIGVSFAEGEVLILVDNASFSSANVMVFEVTSATGDGASSLPVRYVDQPDFSGLSGSPPQAVATFLSSSAVQLSSTLATTSDTVSVIKNHILYTGPSGDLDSRLAFRVAANQIYSSAAGLLDLEAASKVAFAINGGAEVFSVDANSVNLTQPLLPTSDNAVNLGSATARFANIFTGDLNLRNDRGDWTLIEENDFISFRNNKTGRRFRMVMEDITGLGNYGPGNDGEM